LAKLLEIFKKARNCVLYILDYKIEIVSLDARLKSNLKCSVCKKNSKTTEVQAYLNSLSFSSMYDTQNLPREKMNDTSIEVKNNKVFL